MIAELHFARFLEGSEARFSRSNVETIRLQPRGESMSCNYSREEHSRVAIIAERSVNKLQIIAKRSTNKLQS